MVRIRNSQLLMPLNGTDYGPLLFKSGSITHSTSGDVDTADRDTGVAKFPNAVIAGGMSAGWVSSNWDEYLRAARPPYNGPTNIFLNFHHYTASAQTVTIFWWAIGY